MYYLRSRYYNPKTARFLTEDTASGKYTDPLSLNKYTYCHNQPVTQDDPTGHIAHIIIGAAIGGVIGAASSLYEQRKAIGTSAYSYRKYWGSVAEGAISGAAVAATGGLSTGWALAGGAAAGLAGNVANQTIRGEGYNPVEAGISALGGAAGVGGAHVAMKAVGNSAVVKTIANALNNAGKQSAAKAGGSALTKTLSAAAKGGIASSAGGASADAVVQAAQCATGSRDEFDGKELAISTLIGGGLGTAQGAISQTKGGQQIAESSDKTTKALQNKLNGLSNSVKAGAKKFLSGNGTTSSGRKNRGCITLPGKSGSETATPYELEPTHPQTKSNRQMNKLTEQIKADGEIKETIKYVEYNGKKYVVDGHHRLIAAKRLHFQEVPIEEVELPYKGYNTIDDLFWCDEY